MAWNSSTSFIRGRAEMMSRVDLLPCILECLDEGLIYIFQPPCNPEDESKWKKLQLSVTAEEYGAREITPMYAYESSDVAAPALSRLIRLRNGNVVFNYRYYNDTLYRTEVTEDFSCPFCLVGCGSYKGLRFHLFAFHDRYFNFEFLAPYDQAVNVSVKTDILKSKTFTVDPKSQTFFFCAKPLRRKIPENFLPREDSDGDQSDSASESFRGDGDAEPMEKADGDSTPTIQSHHDLDPAPLLVSEPNHETPRVQQVSRPGKTQVEPDHATPEVLKQVAKEGKLPVEPDHGTPAVQQVAKEGNLPVELDHESPSSQQVAEKGNLPTECDHATPTVQQVSKKTNLPVEPDHGTSLVQRVAKKGRLAAVEPDHEMTPAVQQPSKNGKLPAVEPDHEMTPEVQQPSKNGKLPAVEPDHEMPPAVQQLTKEGKLPVVPDHGMPTEQQVAKKGNLPVEPDHGTPAVQKVSKKGKLSVEPGRETPTVQRAAKKGRLSVDLGGETSVQQAAKKGRLSVEPGGETPTVQQAAKKGRSVEPGGETPTVQQAAKKGRLTIEANHKTPAVKQAAKKGKLQVESDLGTSAVQQVAKKGKSTVEPDHGTATAQQAAKKGKSPVAPDHGSPAGTKKRKGKLPVKHSDPQSTSLLSKRPFFHSRTYQPMSLEEVLSGHDSETEVDDDIRDIEDRTLIDKFDLTKDEKDILFMWNTFIRRQRVLIDSHIPWACKAFSKQHAPLLVQSPELALNWRVFMIKLWNHKLLDAETINACNIIIEEYQKQNSDPPS